MHAFFRKLYKTWILKIKTKKTRPNTICIISRRFITMQMYVQKKIGLTASGYYPAPVGPLILTCNKKTTFEVRNAVRI